MAFVRSFRIHPDHGVPDKDMREYINKAERELGIVTVHTTYIPPTYVDGTLKADARLTLIITKLDDAGVDISVSPEPVVFSRN